MDATKVSRKKKIAVIAIIVTILVALALGNYYYDSTHRGNVPVVTTSSDGSFTYTMTSTFGDESPEERGTIVITIYYGSVILTACDITESTMTNVPDWASDSDDVSFKYDDTPADTGIGSKNSMLNETRQGRSITTTQFKGEYISVCDYTRSIDDIYCTYLADDNGTIYEIVVCDDTDDGYEETFTLIDRT